MDVYDFFQGLGIDTKNKTSGSFYTKCPKCHDERKKQASKELLVNLDTGYTECFHCGWHQHILQATDREKITWTPPPPKPRKFITPEPVFNWVIPDAVISPEPSKPMRGKFQITWYYRDKQDRLTAAKRMDYDFHENGFNRIDAPPVHLFTRDAGYVPCLFYERDLHNFPSATVVLVESEKTAAILRKKFKAHLKEFIYLAVGGANGLTDEKAAVLAGRKVLICYDCDNGEKQADGTIKNPKGREGAETAHTKLAAICTSFIVDIDPEKTDGTDLADVDPDFDFIRGLSGKQSFPADLIDKIKDRNRAGDPWNRKAADEIAQVLLINIDKVYEIGRVYYQTNRHEFGVNSAPLLKKIEYFLGERYEFQRNSVNKKVFYRDRKSKDSRYTFCNYNDVWRLLQHNLDAFGKKIKITITDVSNLLESDYVKEVNPFHEYFHGLPHWDGVDHIGKLADYVRTTDQNFWKTQFRKALIRMIACTYQGIENRIIMVLVQPLQEAGKDSWLRFLCPPELAEYYKEDPMTVSKDTEIALCENFMWNLTELDQLNKKEISEIKGIISRASVKQRRAYGRQEQNMKRTVNFWGSTNKEEFLTDTQNTRWLCFRVEDINFNYNDYINGTKEIDISRVWAQAWYLYKSGEPFTLNTDERKQRDLLNHTFEYSSSEKQLIIKYLTPCDKDAPTAEFMTNVEILEYLVKQTDNKLRLAPENVGRAMTQLDFIAGNKKINSKSVRGYYVLKQALLNGVKSHTAQEKEVEPPPPMLFGDVPGQEDDMPF